MAVTDKHDGQNVMIQLPWVVPPQEGVKTIVIQQPAKTHMELNASTDKTAITSFSLSVVIALILGWLAYWYGRKSFELTEMSFKTVSADIKQAAETNRSTTLELIKSQQDLMIKNQKIEIFKENRNEFKFNSIDFIVQAEAFATYIALKSMEYANYEFKPNTDDKDSIEYKVHQEIQSKIISLEVLQSKIQFSAFNFRLHKYDDLSHLIASVIKATAELNNLLLVDNNLSIEDIHEFRKKIEQLIILVTEILEREIILENFLD